MEIVRRAACDIKPERLNGRPAGATMSMRRDNLPRGSWVSINEYFVYLETLA